MMQPPGYLDLFQQFWYQGFFYGHLPSNFQVFNRFLFQALSSLCQCLQQCLQLLSQLLPFELINYEFLQKPLDLNLGYKYELVIQLREMGGKLDSCSQPTHDATEIMQRTFMGKVQQHHTLIRRKRSKKQQCGTYVTPPPNDVWYQCQSCYHLTLKRLGRDVPKKKELKKQTPEELQAQVKQFLFPVLQQSVRDFQEEIEEKIEEGGILALDKNVQVFYSPNYIEFKVDLKKSVPQNRLELKPILQKILVKQVQTLNKSKQQQGRPKQIRKLFIKKGQFGNTRIDIYIKIFHHQRFFGIAWCYILSPWTRPIEKQYFQPSSYGNNMMELNQKFYGDIFAQEYNVKY